MSYYRRDARAPDLAVTAALQFMTRWTECLHGDGSLRETLTAFCTLSLAEVAHLHRINTITGGQRSISTVDLRASSGARPLTHAHGMALAGATSSRAKPGTLWAMLDLDREITGQLDPRVLEWMEDRRLREAMLVPLSQKGDQVDVLEFYLAAPLDRARRFAIETVVAAAAEAWGRRPEGRIARLLRVAPAINAHLAAARFGAHPLSESNPLGLTAAELRICGMIQRGIALDEASERLGIADSTLRTHLRSIFAKAGVAGQVGLVRLLLDPHATAGMSQQA